MTSGFHGRGVHQPPNWRKRRFFRAAGEPFGTIALPLLDAVVPKCCKPRLGKKIWKTREFQNGFLWYMFCPTKWGNCWTKTQQILLASYSLHLECSFSCLIPNWDYAAPICWQSMGKAWQPPLWWHLQWRQNLAHPSKAPGCVASTGWHRQVPITSSWTPIYLTHFDHIYKYWKIQNFMHVQCIFTATSHSTHHATLTISNMFASPFHKRFHHSES